MLPIEWLYTKHPLPIVAIQQDQKDDLVNRTSNWLCCMKADKLIVKFSFLVITRDGDVWIFVWVFTLKDNVTFLGVILDACPLL